MKRLTLISLLLAVPLLSTVEGPVLNLVEGPAWAAVKDFAQPDAYAVVIGISQYREEVIPKVAYAVKDAEAVAQVLERQGGIPKTHIKLLTDAKATVGDFRNSFGDWLRMRVKPDSTVYVYYAGHGTPNPKTGEAYLVPWEGDPDYPDRLYPLNDLYAALNQLPAKDIIVLLDSCFSGAEGRSVLAKGVRPMILSADNPVLASKKVIVVAAATGNQISSDYDKAGHGLFTHALLMGLHGAADRDKDGLVTLHELFPYVRAQVAHTAVEELNREQTPVLLPGEESLGARSALPIALVMPSEPEMLNPSVSRSQAEQKLAAERVPLDAKAIDADVERNVDQTLKEFSRNISGAQEYLKDAKGVLVFPSVYKAGFIWGVEYGKGALRVGGKTVGYYNLSTVSFGLQVGVQKSSLIMTFMEDSVLEKFQSRTGFELGLDGNVTVFTVGAGGSLDTTKLGEPIRAFVFDRQGLIAGITLEGSKFTKLDFE
jgi:lipid-binding SYLF domain-containing protein/uncharacterized caspase-like protein